MTQKPFMHEKRILLVDENRDFLDAVVEALDRCVVHTARNSCEAVKLLENKSYDVVMLTLCGDGPFHLLKRALKSRVVVVVLTLRAVSTPTRKRLREMGPVFFFGKEKIMELGEFLGMLFSKKSYPFTRSLSYSELVGKDDMVYGRLESMDLRREQDAKPKTKACVGGG